MWFFGSGAIHKGLDRALEAFARRPELRLHVVGNIAEETDFMTAYHRELFGLQNVRFHGFLDPAGGRFARIAEDSSFLIAPTCSESVSSAVASMLVLGLYPVISRQTGINLPQGCGRYLEDCSVEDVEQAGSEVAAMDAASRLEQALTIQADAVDRYSRARFTAAMYDHLVKALL